MLLVKIFFEKMISFIDLNNVPGQQKKVTALLDKTDKPANSRVTFGWSSSLVFCPVGLSRWYLYNCISFIEVPIIRVTLKAADSSISSALCTR